MIRPSGAERAVLGAIFGLEHLMVGFDEVAARQPQKAAGASL